ncbi:MAG TPA: hypothetical protein VNN77_05390 [candidate division Zixibacteria bacterium]|nr:hypothetical protein [candidate division Zixibacteria bacterium]
MELEKLTGAVRGLCDLRSVTGRKRFDYHGVEGCEKEVRFGNRPFIGVFGLTEAAGRGFHRACHVETPEPGRSRMRPKNLGAEKRKPDGREQSRYDPLQHARTVNAISHLSQGAGLQAVCEGL